MSNNLIVLVVVLSLFLICACDKDSFSNKAPYPPSSVIHSVEFDFDSHIRRAEGSDNWPTTWADDDHQYTSWGDGGGFGGSNTEGRVSLGVARIEGERQEYVGYNVWGGFNPEKAAEIDGKSYGLISIEGILYMWVSPGSNQDGYKEARLYNSIDHGRNWQKSSWAFAGSDGLVNPTFVQFGKDAQDSRDNYVYMYAVQVKDSRSLQIQKPGEIVLFRVMKNKIMDRDAYEFFAGKKEDEQSFWTKILRESKPIFTDRNGVGWNCAVIYNKGLQRYLLTTEHLESFKGNLGIFEAPEPWGPWSTIYYGKFGEQVVEKTTFYWNFSPKWLSQDGKDFVFVFTGIRNNDSWNSIRGKFYSRNQ